MKKVKIKNNQKIVLFVFVLFVAAVAFPLTACGKGNNDNDSSSVVNISEPGANAPAHEQLFYTSKIMLDHARLASDSGVTLQAEYSYGLALAPVSALRFCTDNILWLKGEGETVDDIVGAAPFGDWDSIIAAGLGSPLPFYFEGLLYQVQGKDAEANNCFKLAKANPGYEEQDFYYLRSMNVDELYDLRNQCVEMELEILEEYTPRAFLYATRTGAEFSPLYHAALAGEKIIEGNDAAAYDSLIKAVLSNPQIPDYYAATVLLGLQTGEIETAMLILNEGLWAFPDNGELNYVAATIEYAAGNMEGARAFLQIAMADPDLSAEFAAECEQLITKIE